MLFNRKTLCSPQKRQFLFICVSLCFSLAFVWASPLFSLSLSLSLSCSLLSCFLPVFHFCFWFLLYLSVLFFVSRCYLVFVFLLVVLLCFESSCLIYCCCVASCFLLLVVLGFCCFHILLFVDFNYLSKTSLKNWKLQKNEKCTKKDILTRAVSTGVLTNSVFFLFCVSLNFACFAESTIK